MTDPQKRQVYDLHGEEGVQQHEQAQHQGHGFPGGFNQGFNFDFGDFFNQGGGFQFNSDSSGFDSGFKSNSHQRRHQPLNLFEGQKVTPLTLANLKDFWRRREMWFIYFYTSDKKGEDYVEQYKLLAEKMSQIFEIAAINCDDEAEEDLCKEEFKVSKYPSIRLYSENSREDPIKIKLHKNLKWNDMSKEASSRMQDFVDIVNEENFDQFILRSESKIKVLLFTQKKTTPAIMKALSSHFKTYLAFGLVRESDTQLVSRFKIKKFPTLIVLNSVDIYDVYDGEIEKNSIMNFLRKYTQKKFEEEKKLKKLTGSYFRMGKCSRPDSNTCVLYFTETEENPNFDAFNEIISRYANEKTDFFYVNTHEQPYFPLAFAELENESDPITSEFVVYFRPKKSRFATLEQEITVDNLITFLDGILGGGRKLNQADPDLIQEFNV